MTDVILAKLIEAAEANPEDDAALAALTDRLSEASPEDRLEAVRRWARMKQYSLAAVSQARQALAGRFGPPQQFVGRITTFPEADEERHLYARRQLRQQGALAAFDAIETDRRYCVRLVESQHVEPGVGVLAGRITLETIVEISPLDGGTVTLPKT